MLDCVRFHASKSESACEKLTSSFRVLKERLTFLFFGKVLCRSDLHICYDVWKKSWNIHSSNQVLYACLKSHTDCSCHRNKHVIHKVITFDCKGNLFMLEALSCVLMKNDLSKDSPKLISNVSPSCLSVSHGHEKTVRKSGYCSEVKLQACV